MDKYDKRATRELKPYMRGRLVGGTFITFAGYDYLEECQKGIDEAKELGYPKQYIIHLPEIEEKLKSSINDAKLDKVS